MLFVPTVGGLLVVVVVVTVDGIVAIAEVVDVIGFVKSCTGLLGLLLLLVVANGEVDCEVLPPMLLIKCVVEVEVVVMAVEVVIGLTKVLDSMAFWVSLCPQQLPNKKPSTHVPKCFPSVLMHSQTNMQVPCSFKALLQGFGDILSDIPFNA